MAITDLNDDGPGEDEMPSGSPCVRSTRGSVEGDDDWRSGHACRSETGEVVFPFPYLPSMFTEQTIACTSLGSLKHGGALLGPDLRSHFSYLVRESEPRRFSPSSPSALPECVCIMFTVSVN